MNPTKALSNERTSILVCNHNYGRFLGPCLDSVLAQSVTAIDLLVVDDHSQDHSPRLLAEYGEKFRATAIRYHYRIEAHNLGQNGLFNKHVPNLKTKYSIILDADDRLDPTYIEKCIGALVEQQKGKPSVGFCHTQMELIDGNGTYIAPARLDADNPAWHCVLPRTALIETALLQAALPLDEHKTRNTKYDLWRKIRQAGGTGIILEHPLFQYRIHDRNVSGIARLLHNPTGQEVAIQAYWLDLARETEAI